MSIYSVSFGANTMVIQLTSSSVPSIISREQVVSVDPVSIETKGGAYPNSLGFGEPVVISTQYGVSVVLRKDDAASSTLSEIVPCDVEDQAGWTNDPAGQQQMIDDIQTWLDA